MKCGAGNRKNPVALITGANQGIGEAVALSLARNNMSVVLSARRKEKLISVAKKIAALGKNAYVMPMDITNEKEVNATIAKLYNIHKRIDILINCAGIYKSKSMLDINISEWREVINTNLTGTFLCCRHIVPIMVKQKSGIIINFASIGGTTGLTNKSAYCASKFGVVGLSKSLAKELQPYGVKVHIIYPFLVDSKSQVNWQADQLSVNELAILNVNDIADLVLKLVTLPKRVQVDELAVKPFMF